MTDRIRCFLSASAGLLVLAAAHPSHAADSMTCTVTEAASPTGAVSSSAPIVFDVSDFSFDGINPATSGSGTGKARFKHLSSSASTDAASSPLLRLAAIGGAIPTIVCAVTNATPSASKPPPYLIVTLTNAALIQFGVSGGDESPQEQVTFEYGGLQIRYNDNGNNR